MKADKKLTLPADIAQTIRLMARANFRTFEEELARLSKRGLSKPTGNDAADRVRLSAELAYLHAEEVEESTEDPAPSRLHALWDRIARGRTGGPEESSSNRLDGPSTLGIFF